MARVVRQVPGPGQESVWDYPRPPRLEPTPARLVVVLGGETVVDTVHGLRVLETSHPPTYYLPVAEFRPGSLRPASGRSVCEWKGAARYFDLLGGDRVAPRAAWGYDDPDPRYAELAGHVALYPAATDRCTVDGEAVVPQPGGFYGGWITSQVVGPFKGEPGTTFW
jgi:uncharacterized protein (DUF427 family)